MTKADMYLVAMAVRHAAETLVEENNLGPAADYTLSGACGDVSMAFAEIVGLTDLYEEGYFNNTWLHEKHCWVRDRDGWVWDLTAMQFDDEYPPILVFKGHSSQHETELTGKEAMDSLDFWGNVKWRYKLKERANQLLGVIPVLF